MRRRLLAGLLASLYRHLLYPAGAGSPVSGPFRPAQGTHQLAAGLPLQQAFCGILGLAGRAIRTLLLLGNASSVLLALLQC